MATQTLSNISAALSLFFEPELTRQFNRQAVLAEILPKDPGAGKSVNWDVRFTRTTHAASFTEGSDVQTTEFQVDNTQAATLGWASYRSAFSLSGISVHAAAGSVGSAVELLNQFRSNLVDAASDLVSQINAALYAGDGTGTNIAGLVGAGALANSGTYAGINRSTFPDWSANVLGNSGTPRALTKALLDQLEQVVYTASGQMPDIIVCTPAIARDYESLFDSMSRVYVERGDVSALGDPAARSNIGAPLIPANTGFTGLSYKGIPIYRDRNATAGTMFMLNSQFVRIRPLPQQSLGSAPVDESMGLQGASNGQPGRQSGIIARVESLAKTGDADKFQLVTYLQLQVRKPQACGVLQDLS